MNVQHAFPIPVATDTLPKIPKSTIEFAKNLKYIPYLPGSAGPDTATLENCHLLISDNKQVLDSYPEFAELRESIFTSTYKFWSEVLGVSDLLKLKIRHSWITKHLPGHANRPHTHTTSIISSCVYLQTADNCGNLVFKKDINYLNLFPSALDLDFKISNIINTQEISIVPKDNLIVFFPSHLNHYTETNTSNTERYCINIDWWFYGKTRIRNKYGFDSDFT
jgi:uncharacterized protein (TIGR02466 family)